LNRPLAVLRTLIAAGVAIVLIVFAVVHGQTVSMISDQSDGSPAIIAKAPELQTPPVLSEFDTLKLKVASLQQQVAYFSAQLQVCQGQLAPQAYKTASDQIQQSAAAIVADFEKAHPGWTIDPASGKAVKKQ